MSGVVDGGQAHQCGIKEEMLIIAVDGTPFEKSEQIVANSKGDSDYTITFRMPEGNKETSQADGK